MSDWFGKEVYKLGFGLMRLPKREDGSNDTDRVSYMVDRFIEAGGTYFDTAFVYDDGETKNIVVSSTYAECRRYVSNSNS